MSLKVEHIVHKGEKRIAVHFENRVGLVERFKQLQGAEWSSSLKVWHLPDTQEYRNKFCLNAINTKQEPKPALCRDTQRRVDQFVQWLRSKRYSQNTIKAYVDAIEVFLRVFPDKALREIDNDDIVRFNNEYVLKRNLSESFQNRTVNAIKLFFKTVENRRLEIEKVHRPKKPKTLP